MDYEQHHHSHHNTHHSQHQPFTGTAPSLSTATSFTTKASTSAPESSSSSSNSRRKSSYLAPKTPPAAPFHTQSHPYQLPPSLFQEPDHNNHNHHHHHHHHSHSHSSSQSSLHRRHSQLQPQQHHREKHHHQRNHRHTHSYSRPQSEYQMDLDPVFLPSTLPFSTTAQPSRQKPSPSRKIPPTTDFIPLSPSSLMTAPAYGSSTFASSPRSPPTFHVNAFEQQAPQPSQTINAYDHHSTYTFSQENVQGDSMTFAPSQYTFQLPRQTQPQQNQHDQLQQYEQQREQQQQYHEQQQQQQQQQQHTFHQYSTATSGSGIPALTNEIGFSHRPASQYYLPAAPALTVTPRSKRPKSLSAHDFAVETTSVASGVDTGGGGGTREGRRGGGGEGRGGGEDVYYQSKSLLSNCSRSFL
ncbi:hypothetical protein K457DRAFT_14289 [Linnemannia elongata AG-77]|uniref:Uncharacterized protein n=1 Tax=Linnemannia elongata AG-77 TaxID=1314771 RepID=A0A197KAC7_9FUNG|nr:hypothetical protein K457DRAFT_14289 [Linnemannia elongata AG-77]